MIKINKSHISKILSGILSLIIICSSVASVSYSAGAESIVETTADASANKKSAEEAHSTFSRADKKLSKEETVYVIADSNGNPSKVIVSDWIKNSVAANKFTDVSNLENIKNVKSNEEYTINENNMLEWEANGNDIYYQGTSTQKLPVGLSVIYSLDGKIVSADSIAGKSGKVKMHFEYDNRQFEEVNINDKKEKIYVPFVMLTGMMLDNNIYHNVEISNGKIINDGSRTYAIGFALPGMQESLKIKDDDFNIPNSFEVTADVTDFSLATTLTIATNDVFSDIDFSKIDEKVDVLSDSVVQLEDAANQLIDGSSELYKGLNTLLDKSEELISGVQKLYDGADQVNSGASKLNKGAGALEGGTKALNNAITELAGGTSVVSNGANSIANGAESLDSGVAELQGYISTLVSGLSTISENNTALVDGAKTVFDTLLSTADTQISASGLAADKLTIDNYGSTIDTLITSISDENAYKAAYNMALQTVASTIESQRDVISEAVEAAVRLQVTEEVLAAGGLSMSVNEYETAVASGAIDEAIQITVSQAVAEKMSSDSIKTAISENTELKLQSLIESNMQSDEIQRQIEAGIEKMVSGRKSLEALKEQLNSYHRFYQGIINYTNGVEQANRGAQQILSGTDTLKAGAGKLVDGSNNLKNGTTSLENGAVKLKSGSDDIVDGASELYSGTSTLSNGTKSLLAGVETLKNGGSALVEGVDELRNGSMSLTEGLKKFKKEGIQSLVNAVDGDAKSLVNRFKAISEVSANYKSFSGISDDMDGKVDFIFKTNKIGYDK